MKKFLSLMLAVLMLALPMGGIAETAEAGMDAAGLVNAVVQKDFTMKYLAEGQQLVTDTRIQAGDGLIGLVPTEYQAPLKELLDALTIEASAQAIDRQAQGAVRILLNGESAADAIAAVDKSGVYAASSFLGEKIVHMTLAQIKTLVNQALEQAVANGQVTQEQVDILKKVYKALRTDPQALIASLVGDADPSALLAAAFELINFEVTPEAVTEKPEDVTIDAAYVMTVPLVKDSIAKVTNELAKFLWSMPGVQKAASMAKINDQPLTEETLTAALNAFPDALAEDIVIKVYLTSDFSTVQALSDIRMTADGQDAREKVNVIVESQGDGAHVVWSVNVAAGDQDVVMGGDMIIAVSENGGSVTHDMTASTKVNGEDFTPMHEVVTVVWTQQADAMTMNMDIAVQAQAAPGGEAIGLNFTVAADEKDLGDHAEANAAVTAAMDGMGDLITVNVAGRTDLAEAYIITPNAVQPYAMSEEELAAFQSELMSNAQLGLINLIGKLPASVQTIVMQLFN